jgi:hypothetical protein
MNRWFYALLLIAGLVVLGVGINAANSVASESSQVVTGTPTDKALWLMLGGGLISLAGLVGLLRKSSALSHG